MAEDFVKDAYVWFVSLPPITRSWLGLSFGITVGVTLDFIPPEQLLFEFDKIYNDLELWRILTSFCYCGGTLNEFSCLMLLYLIYIEAKQYEDNPYPVPTSSSSTGRSNNNQSPSPRRHDGRAIVLDCAFCYLFCILSILISYVLICYYVPVDTVYLYPCFTRTLAHSIIYIWSKRNANTQITYIVVPMKARYAPFGHVVINLILNHRVPNEIMHGFVVGHFYFYLIDILPTILGRPVLMMPKFLALLLGDDLVEPDENSPPLQQNEPNNRVDNNNDNSTEDRMHAFYRDEEGATRAHIAAKEGLLEDLQYLSENASSQVFHAQDNNSWQPLHEAVRGGFLDIVDFLVEQHNVDINARTCHERGPNALWLAEDFHGLDHPVTRRLIELGATSIPPSED